MSTAQDIPFDVAMAMADEVSSRISDLKRENSALKKRLGEVFDRDAEFLKLVKSLVIAARTSGGVAGRDEGLCAACVAIENMIIAEGL